MKSQFTIEAKLDTSDFDKHITDMQRKLKDIYAPQDTIRMQNMTAQRAGVGGSPLAGGNPMQIKRDLDQLIANSVKGQEALAKTIVQRYNSEKSIINLMKESIGLDNQRKMILDQELKAHQAVTNELERQFGVTDKIVNTMISTRNGPADRAREFLKNRAPAGPGQLDFTKGFVIGGAGGGDEESKGGRGDAFLKGAAMLSKAVAAVVALAATGTALINQYASLPIRTAAATGSAVQGLVGQQVQEMASGALADAFGWDQERQEARDEAERKMKMTWAAPNEFSAGGIMDWLGAGASRVTGGRIGKQSETSFYAGKVQTEAQDYQTGFQGRKQQEVGKAMATQRIQENWQNDLATQRMLGLDYGTFHGVGGFEEQANQEGFTPGMRTGIAGQMIGAGGSTRAAAGSASMTGLQAQRAYGMTNAGAVMGRISGGAGSSQATDAVFKAVLAASVKAGLDSSEFREEQRKFADITSQVLEKTGVSTAADAEALLNGFSRFMGANPTMRDIAGAKSAYEEYQGQTAETSGRRGGLQFAAMMSMPGGKQLGAAGIGGLMEMPEQDLISSNPFVVSESAKLGISPQKLIDQVKTQKRRATILSYGLDPDKLKRYQDYAKKKGLPSTLSHKQLMNLQRENKEMFDIYTQTEEAVTYGSTYENPQKREAMARSFRSGQPVPMDEQTTKEVESKLKKKGKEASGRVEDEWVQSLGVANQAILKSFREYKDVIIPAAGALDTFNKKVAALLTTLHYVSPADKPGVLSAGQKGLSTTQQQGNKKAPGK